MRSGWLSSSRSYDVNREIAGIKSDLSDIMDRMSHLTGAAGDSVRSNVASLAETRDRLSGRAQGLMDQGRDWYGSADHEVRHGIKQARTTVQENPLTGIAIAAGIGFLLGLSTRLR